MKKIILNPNQTAELEALVREAYIAGGTVFCQCRRLDFPENTKLSITCHLIPPESSTRLRAFLTKEAERLNKTNQTKGKVKP